MLVAGRAGGRQVKNVPLFLKHFGSRNNGCFHHRPRTATLSSPSLIEECSGSLSSLSLLGLSLLESSAPPSDQQQPSSSLRLLSSSLSSSSSFELSSASSSLGLSSSTVRCIMPVVSSSRIVRANNELHCQQQRHIHSSKRIDFNNEEMRSRAKGTNRITSTYDPLAIDKMLHEMQESDSNPAAGRMRVNEKEIKMLMQNSSINGQWEKSLELFNCVVETGNPVLSLSFFNLVFDILQKESSADDVFVYIEIMNEVEIAPTANIYNTLISALGKERRIPEMNQIFSEMKDAGVAPNAGTYNIVIDALGKNGWMLEMNQIFSEMKDAGMAQNANTNGTYNRMLSALGKDGQVLEMKQIFSEMRDAGIAPNARTYNIMIYSLGEDGQILDMKQIFSDMKDDGIAPDEYCCKLMINALEKDGQVREAKQMLSDMRDARIAPNKNT
jgi:pentatricopeptide repeat protein